MNADIQAKMEALQKAFDEFEDVTSCRNCKHYDRYWYCQNNPSICSQCIITGDGVFYEEPCVSHSGENEPQTD
jgi:hypothetical protein